MQWQRDPTMLIKTCLRTSLIILLITCLGSPAQAQPFGIENRVPNTSLLIADLPAAEPGSMQIERAFPALSFTQPVLMIEIPDGSQRLCVVQKNGQLKAFVKSQNPSAAAVFTFLDISDRVLNAGEQGLLGLAFDPDYAANGEFYWFAQSLAIQFRRLKRIFVCRGCWPGNP